MKLIQPDILILYHIRIFYNHMWKCITFFIGWKTSNFEVKEDISFLPITKSNNTLSPNHSIAMNEINLKRKCTQPKMPTQFFPHTHKLVLLQVFYYLHTTWGQKIAKLVKRCCRVKKKLRVEFKKRESDCKKGFLNFFISGSFQRSRSWQVSLFSSRGA